MADVQSSLSDLRPTDAQLRYIGAALALLVANIHLFHPKRGFPRLALLVYTDTVYLLLADPRPLLFVVSGLAIIVGVLLALWGFARKPLYIGGIVLMLAYVIGYFAWHLSGHGGFLPGRKPIYHGLSPLQAVIDHLQAYPIARTSKIVETLLLVVLAALYQRES